MSYYTLQPDISTWDTQYNPFTLTIRAYDNNNIRVSNKQFYAVYDITYDKSIPNLEHAQTLYSDKDGNLGISFNRRCHLTLDLYIVSTYDDSIDISEMADQSQYNCFHVCTNKYIPFAPFIQKFSVKYLSTEAISATDNIPRENVQVTLLYSNNTTKQFTLEDEKYNDFILTPSTIEHINDNTITVSYYDDDLEQTWSDSIIVNGKIKEIGLNATYIGQSVDINGDGIPDTVKEKQLNDYVFQSEIMVVLVTYDGYSEYRTPLSSNEWQFTDIPIINNINLGVFEIVKDDLKCIIRVPFSWEVTKSHIDAWYEGESGQVGDKISLDDFRVYLYHPNNNRELLSPRNYQVVPSDLILRKTGVNWFTVSYTYEEYTLYDKVAVMVYTGGQEHLNKDFEMLYFDPNLHSVIDVTEEFDEICMVGDARFFNWNKILDYIIDTIKFGHYKLIAPKLTGLSVRNATEWFITCLYKKALNAMLIKEFDQE